MQDCAQAHGRLWPLSEKKQKEHVLVCDVERVL